jgi:hypothetical protein
MSLWENEDTAREQRLQRILIITAGVAAVGIVLLLGRLAATRMMHPANGIGFTNVERERSLIATDPVEGDAPRTASFSPGYAPHPFVRTQQSGRPGYGPTFRPAVPPPTYAAADLSPLTESEKSEAVAALAPLRDAYLAVREYDRRSFWHGGGLGGGGSYARPVQIGPYPTTRELNALPRPGSALTNDSAAALAAGSSDFAPGGGGGIPGPGDGEAAGSGSASGFGGGTATRGAGTGATDGAATAPYEPVEAPARGSTPVHVDTYGAGSSAAVGSVQSVDDATSALSALVSLYGHPDRFPAPVRSDVGAASKAMREYLKITMDVAESGDASAISAYRPAAAQRLADSDAALRRVEQTVYSSTNAGSPTGIAR